MRSIYLLCTTLLFLCFAKLAQGQTNTYVPFPDSAAKWNEESQSYSGNDSIEYSTNMGYYYRISHDTIINSLSYSLINCAYKWQRDTNFLINHGILEINNVNYPRDSFGSLGFAIREDTMHKVYVRYLRNQDDCNGYMIDTDILLYDFSLKPGDTVSTLMYGHDITIVMGYDSVLIGTTYRNALDIYYEGVFPFNTGYDEWVEGIGSLEYGLLGSYDSGPTFFDYECETYLDCFSLNNQTLLAIRSGCDTIIPYQYTAGINTISLQTLSLQIFPNPASDELFLKFPQSFIPKEITIYNILGQQINLPFTSNATTSLDVKNLPAGLYFIRATDNNTVLTDSFIKE